MLNVIVLSFPNYLTECSGKVFYPRNCEAEANGSRTVSATHRELKTRRLT